MAPFRKSTDCLVETLTTASMTCSATSAMPSGPRAAAGEVKAGQAMATAVKIAKPARPTGLVKRKKDAPMGVESPGGKLLMRVAPTSRRFKGTANRYRIGLISHVIPEPAR